MPAIGLPDQVTGGGAAVNHSIRPHPRPAAFRSRPERWDWCGYFRAGAVGEFPTRDRNMSTCRSDLSDFLDGVPEIGRSPCPERLNARR